MLVPLSAASQTVSDGPDGSDDGNTAAGDLLDWSGYAGSELLIGLAANWGSDRFE